MPHHSALPPRERGEMPKAEGGLQLDQLQGWGGRPPLQPSAASPRGVKRRNEGRDIIGQCRDALQGSTSSLARSAVIPLSPRTGSGNIFADANCPVIDSGGSIQSDPTSPTSPASSNAWSSRSTARSTSRIRNAIAVEISSSRSRATGRFDSRTTRCCRTSIPCWKRSLKHWRTERLGAPPLQPSAASPRGGKRGMCSTLPQRNQRCPLTDYQLASIGRSLHDGQTIVDSRPQAVEGRIER